MAPQSPTSSGGSVTTQEHAGAAPPLATILITTKDRKDELRTALRSALAQDVPTDILVVDDGSTDDTSAMVRAEFPMVRLERNEAPLGIVDARIKAAHQSRAPILFTLDDDAEFTSPACVRQTLRFFDHPRVAAVTIPLINFLGERRVRINFPETDASAEPLVMPQFMGGANALRLAAYHAVGGYSNNLVRQFEESDISLRFLKAGYIVRMGDADPINHYPSMRRMKAEVCFYVSRNRLLFAWNNAPMPRLAAEWLAASFTTWRAGARQGFWLAPLRGVASAAGAAIRTIRSRRPASRNIYSLYRTLVAKAPVPLSRIEHRLPPCPDAPSAPAAAAAAVKTA